jgi:hypothetical protein
MYPALYPARETVSRIGRAATHGSMQTHCQWTARIFLTKPQPKVACLRALSAGRLGD